MSNRAEERALECYPVKMINHFYTQDWSERLDCNKQYREIYLEGYEQAEKDLALTIDDIKTIIHIYGIICEERKFGTLGEIYEEVMKRFNEAKKR